MSKRSLRRFILPGLGVFALLIPVLLRVFVIEAYKVPAGSMMPSLLVGDHFFVMKRQTEPNVGQAMVFRFPENRQQDFVKRVIAPAGSTLEIADHRPVINGWRVPHCYVGKDARGHVFIEFLGDASYYVLHDDKPSERACKADRDCGGARRCVANLCGRAQGPYTVPKGEVYVLGDNRNNSHDSRSWAGGVGRGVPVDDFKGKVGVVWHSAARESRMGATPHAPFVASDAPPAIRASVERCLAKRPAQTRPPTP